MMGIAKTLPIDLRLLPILKGKKYSKSPENNRKAFSILTTKEP